MNRGEPRAASSETRGEHRGVPASIPSLAVHVGGILALGLGAAYLLIRWSRT
jgi:hypothetical protein